MKTLQNNFTTPEQSKRLLELGVPADSADCIYPCYKQEGESDKQIMYGHINVKHPAGSFPKCFIPCWSVGRLIEIYETICLKRIIIDFKNVKYVHERQSNLVEDLIVCIEGHKIISELYPQFYKLDFSKLEE